MARKKEKLTLKQKAFAKKVVETKSPTEAADLVYDCKNRVSAASVGSITLGLPKVQREVERIMDQQDLTDEKIVKKLNEGLDAKVVTDYKGIIEKSNVPDLKTRHKYLDTAVKIKGLEAPKQIEKKSMNIDLQLEAMPLEEIIVLVKQQLKMLKSVQK
jgi:hypothetical protein